MPIYEYHCATCHTAFETLRPMKEADNPIACRTCHSMDTSRTLSLFAAHVKGNTGSHANGGCGGCNGGSCGSCGCGHH